MIILTYSINSHFGERAIIYDQLIEIFCYTVVPLFGIGLGIGLLLRHYNLRFMSHLNLTLRTLLCPILILISFCNHLQIGLDLYIYRLFTFQV